MRVMIEVEVKVRVPDPQFLQERFEENNGIYKRSLLHEDTYFNMPNGLRNFKETDEALRLRKSIEFNKKDKTQAEITNFYLTYKGSKIDNTTKTREEIEIKIDSLDKMLALLKVLGFQEVLTVKKERELYEFEYKLYFIEVLLDYLPILDQHFLEVEFLLDSHENLEESKEILFDFLKLFGIEKEESIRKSYLELIVERLKEI
jgi:adenylate cyclase class 2